MVIKNTPSVVGSAASREHRLKTDDSSNIIVQASAGKTIFYTPGSAGTSSIAGTAQAFHASSRKSFAIETDDTSTSN